MGIARKVGTVAGCVFGVLVLSMAIGVGSLNPVDLFEARLSAMGVLVGALAGWSIERKERRNAAKIFLTWGWGGGVVIPPVVVVLMVVGLGYRSAGLGDSLLRMLGAHALSAYCLAFLLSRVASWCNARHCLTAR